MTIQQFNGVWVAAICGVVIAKGRTESEAYYAALAAMK